MAPTPPAPPAHSGDRKYEIKSPLSALNLESSGYIEKKLILNGNIIEENWKTPSLVLGDVGHKCVCQNWKGNCLKKY